MQLTSAVAHSDGDAALVARAKLGDRDAFARLVASRAERAMRTARAILGSETDAHDAVQNTYIAAWVNLPRLRDEHRFDAWTNRILRNECTEVLRRRGSARIVDLTEATGTAGLGQPGTDPVERLEATAIKSAFRRLSVDDRTILLLHHLHDLSLDEVARQLAIPVGTAKSRLWGARRALERALEIER